MLIHLYKLMHLLLHLMRKIFNHHIDIIQILWATFVFLLVIFFYLWETVRFHMFSIQICYLFRAPVLVLFLLIISLLPFLKNMETASFFGASFGYLLIYFFLCFRNGNSMDLKDICRCASISHSCFSWKQHDGKGESQQQKRKLLFTESSCSGGKRAPLKIFPWRKCNNFCRPIE